MYQQPRSMMKFFEMIQMLIMIIYSINYYILHLVCPASSIMKTTLKLYQKTL